MASKSDKANKQEMGPNTFIAGAIVVSVLSILICGIIANNLIHSLVLNSKVIGAKTDIKKQLDTKVTNAPQLMSAYDQLGNRKDAILSALPIESDFPQLVTIAEQMATTAGVRLSSINPSQGTGSSAAAPTTSTSAATSTSSTAAPVVLPVEYDFSMSVKGPYDRVVQFLKNIELSARPMHVVSVTFSGSGSSLSADVSLATYYQDKADITDKTRVIK